MSLCDVDRHQIVDGEHGTGGQTRYLLTTTGVCCCQTPNFCFYFHVNIRGNNAAVHDIQFRRVTVLFGGVLALGFLHILRPLPLCLFRRWAFSGPVTSGRILFLAIPGRLPSR